MKSQNLAKNIPQNTLQKKIKQQTENIQNKTQNRTVIKTDMIHGGLLLFYLNVTPAYLSSKFFMKLSKSILSIRTKSPTPTSRAAAIFLVVLLINVQN